MSGRGALTIAETLTLVRAPGPLALACVGLALSGCLATHGAEALEVEITVASVTLADDCGGGAAPVAGERCDSDAPCPDLCQQSSLQLRIEASDDGVEVPFEIVSIRVVDPDTGGSTTLTARNPRVFADGYVAWDETIAPSDELSVSYDTSAPSWSALDRSGDSAFGWGHVYEVEVRVRVDGVERTLITEAMREPDIAT